MDSPNMIANIRTGMVGLIVPFGVKPSSPDRCPSWKIQVTTPNIADSDRTFIAIACTGRTSDPNARNISRNVAATTASAIHGRVWPRLDSASERAAVCPPAALGGGRALHRAADPQRVHLGSQRGQQRGQHDERGEHV